MYWTVIVSNSFFGSTSNLKQIGKASMSHIMTQTAKNNAKYFKRSQNLFVSGWISQEIAGMHN